MKSAKDYENERRLHNQTYHMENIREVLKHRDFHSLARDHRSRLVAFRFLFRLSTSRFSEISPN